MLERFLYKTYSSRTFFTTETFPTKRSSYCKTSLGTKRLVLLKFTVLQSNTNKQGLYYKYPCYQTSPVSSSSYSLISRSYLKVCLLFIVILLIFLWFNLSWKPLETYILGVELVEKRLSQIDGAGEINWNFLYCILGILLVGVGRSSLTFLQWQLSDLTQIKL